jgi:epoxyqueuosine reductase
MGARRLTAEIKRRTRTLGFDLVGISPAGPLPDGQRYKDWLSMGHAGEMHYLERRVERREDIRNILPGAKSVITCGLNYNTDAPYSTSCRDNKKGWVARYAWGDDYHDVMDEKLSALSDFIRAAAPGTAEIMRYSDTGPVLERAHARYGGAGWIGKNTCLINQETGSWIFLGELITDLELEYDSTVPDRCGTCTRCIDACPTGALTAPYTLDSRRCISYLTIELKDKIPFDLRDGIGSNIFGCDICQDVCPWNRKAPVTDEASFQARPGLYNPGLVAVSSLGPDEFRALFKGSPVKRTKRRGLIRNALVAIGNSGDADFVPVVNECLGDEEPLVRIHALWALWKLEGKGSLGALLSVRESESDQSVIEEIDNILESMEKPERLKASG